MSSQHDIEIAVDKAISDMSNCGCAGCSCFDSCVGRLRLAAGGGSLRPAPRRWRSLLHLFKWIKNRSRRLFPLLLLFAGLNVSADVVCEANTNSGGYTFCCSGDGEGPDGTLVGNMIGVCTNCLKMTPQQMHDFKIDALDVITGIETNLSFLRANISYVIENLLSPFIEEVIYITDLGFPVPISRQADMNNATNWIVSVALPRNDLATQCAQSVFPYPFARNSNALNLWGGAYRGAHEMALKSASVINDSKDELGRDLDRVGYLDDNLVPALRTSITSLTEDACDTAFNAAVANSNSSGGSSSGSVGVATNGNWCTYEQGEAIKELLEELNDWQQRKFSMLKGISNEVVRVRQAIVSGLYTDNISLPRNLDWQDVYFSGSGAPGYEPTNILQRIELLVYGISGISTNGDASAWDEDTTPDPDSADFADVQSSLSELSTDSSSSELQSLAGALSDFFDAFSGLDGDQIHRGDIVIDEIPIQLGNDRFTVPGIQASDSSALVTLANDVQGLIRTGFSVVYSVIGAFLVFFFWRWFAVYAVNFTKWATEILTNLFSG